MSAELQPLTPTTDHLAKRAYVYIRQSSLMQVTRHAESTDLQYSFVQRAVALGWPREGVEIIDEDLGKSGADAFARPDGAAVARPGQLARASFGVKSVRRLILSWPSSGCSQALPGARPGMNRSLYDKP